MWLFMQQDLQQSFEKKLEFTMSTDCFSYRQNLDNEVTRLEKTSSNFSLKTNAQANQQVTNLLSLTLNLNQWYLQNPISVMLRFYYVN